MAEIILPPEEEQEETPQVPELNIDKPTDNSKVITIEFEAKKTNKVSTKDTNQQLYTTDTDAWFEFKETSLEGANGTYSVVFRNRHDGSIFQRTGDVVNGVAYYKIPHQEIRHAGAWRGQLVYTLENGNTTAREFGYDVKGHILDGKDVREIVVEDFETLMAQLRSMKDSAELELASLKQELRNTTDTAEQNETDRQVFFDGLVEDIDELQANYQELLDTGVLQTNINTKLEALEEEYAPKLTEVTEQLAHFTAEVSTPITNLVTNGSFAGGESGWAKLLVGTSSTTNNELIFTANAKNGRFHQGLSFPDGHYIYRSAEIKATSTLVFLGRGTGRLKKHTGSGQYERLSDVSNWTTNKNISVVDGREAGWSPVSVKNVVAIDLTAHFGAGNEPTASEMDTFLANNFTNGWFDGTGSIIETVGSVPTFVANTKEHINELTKSRVEVVNIKEMFGAIPGGTTDNTQAILNAVAYVKGLDDAVLYLPSGTYHCSQDVLIDGVRRINFEGTVQLATGKKLDVYYDSFKANAEWKFTDVTGGKLRVGGLNSSNVMVLKARELELYAHGDVKAREFIAYNTFTMGKVDTLTLFSEGIIIGWINENRFYGGRCQEITFDGNYPHDNNIFYGTMLEQFKLNMVKGANNYFYDVRFEGTNNIKFGEQTHGNIMYRSYHDSPFEYLRGTSGVNHIDNGFDNHIVSNQDAVHDRKVLLDINSESSNYSLEALSRNEHDLTIESSWKPIYESEIIELKNPIGLIINSDKSLFFVTVKAYDENKNLLKTEQEDFTSIPGGVFYSGGGDYTYDANIGAGSITGIPVAPTNTVKYFSYTITTGTEDIIGQSFNSLQLVKVESIQSNTSMKTQNIIDRWSSPTVPTKGYWKVGDMVYNSTPSASSPTAYWLRVTSGSSNVLGTDWIAK